jgi:hypothetical protein
VYNSDYALQKLGEAIDEVGETPCMSAPDLFFPEREESFIREAKALCQTCPVISQCGEYALAARERHGIWGGMSWNDRVEIIRKGRGKSW